MRILHTSDWHLGRLFHGVHLTEDQAYVLEQVKACARDARPDVVIVAGDIYDRAVPPTGAVAILNEVLSELVLGIGLRVIMIAGNHDSPERLDFGSTIMADRGLHMAARLSEATDPIIIGDAHGPVLFYPLTYAEPAAVRECLRLETIRDYNGAISTLVARIKASRPQGVRSVLIAHAFVAGGLESESERPLSVGGAGTVDADCLGDFDYVALGHLHSPQKVGDGTSHYSGSLLKYSFSETAQEKCMKLVEMGATGECSVETIPLLPRHDVRAVTGFLDDLVGQEAGGSAKEDYLSVTLLDKGAVYDPMGKLREVYPNVLEIKRPAVTTAGEDTTPRIDHRKMSEIELFTDFYREVTGEPLSAEQRSAFIAVTERLRQSDREAGA